MKKIALTVLLALSAPALAGEPAPAPAAVEHVDKADMLEMENLQLRLENLQLTATQVQKQLVQKQESIKQKYKLTDNDGVDPRTGEIKRALKAAAPKAKVEKK